MGGLISASISIYFWLINLFLDIESVADKIHEITEKTDDKTSNILDTGILGVRLLILSIFLFILNQLNNLGLKNWPIIRTGIQIIWQFLEQCEKILFGKGEDNNKDNPPDVQSSDLPINQGPTPNLGPINPIFVNTEYNKKVKILKTKKPIFVRKIKIQFKKIQKFFKI